MNRAERRARGFYEPVGLLPDGLEDYVPQEQLWPRYVRRNILAFLPGRTLTRRVRKQRARALSIMRKGGITEVIRGV